MKTKPQFGGANLETYAPRIIALGLLLLVLLLALTGCSKETRAAAAIPARLE